MIWSSPLLLLVLVFTLTTSAKSLTTTTTSTTSATTAGRVVSTTTLPVPTTVAHRASPTTSIAPVVATPSGTVAPHYAVSTASTAKSPGRASSANALSGTLAGELTSPLGVADVPLRGPGSWTLTSSAPILAQLQCPDSSGSEVGRVTISGAQSCQLQLTTANLRLSPTWQLTRVR
jgi:hypothetical protein